MDKMMMNDSLLKQKHREMDFLHHFHQRGYDLIDLGIVESFDWSKLSHDDLQLMHNRHKWQHDGKIFALRSDWTNAIVRYRKQYQLKTSKIAYSGSVYTIQNEKQQLGVEIFEDSVPAQMNVLHDMISFIQTDLKEFLTVAVISHNKLLKKIMKPAELEDDLIRKFISERNRDALMHRLDADHPIISLMERSPDQQTAYLEAHYPELRDNLKELSEWKQALINENIDCVYADILALPTQSYYRGIFIHLYAKDQVEPVASGGQYTSSSKAFGMAIIDNGGKK